AADGQCEGTQREPDLDGDSEERQPEATRVPFVAEERCDGRRAEPRCHREEEPGGEEGERQPATRRLLRAPIRPVFSLAHPAPRRTWSQACEALDRQDEDRLL